MYINPHIVCRDGFGGDGMGFCISPDAINFEIKYMMGGEGKWQACTCA